MSETRVQLYENKWVSLYQASDHERGVDGFVYSHESRCNGQIVAVLPYRWSGVNGLEFLLHSENNPAWGWGPHLASVTGGVDTFQPAADAAREVREETGYDVKQGDLVPLGTCHGVKSCDTLYHLFAVDLTAREQGEVDPDSLLEASEHPVWVVAADVVKSPDPLVSALVLRWWHERDLQS